MENWNSDETDKKNETPYQYLIVQNQKLEGMINKINKELLVLQEKIRLLELKQNKLY